MNKHKKPAIRVLLADDHPIVMTGFAMSLEAQGLDVVGQARTPQEALEQFKQLKPDVVVLDIRFGDELTGLDVARQILARTPSASIVFLSQFDQDSLIKETYRLGGRAFITKDCDPADLAAAVLRAHEGELYFLPQIAERALEIFTLMAEGLTNAEIAEKLNVSTKTISNISQAVKEKLGVHRPAYITRLALKHGLIEP